MRALLVVACVAVVAWPVREALWQTSYPGTPDEYGRAYPVFAAPVGEAVSWPAHARSDWQAVFAELSQIAAGGELPAAPPTHERTAAIGTLAVLAALAALAAVLPPRVFASLLRRRRPGPPPAEPDAPATAAPVGASSVGASAAGASTPPDPRAAVGA